MITDDVQYLIMNRLAGDIRNVSHKLNYADAASLDPLIERIGDSRIVMLGESSHGTHEFYMWRAAISKRLIEEKGFSFIAVEGDWPDCYRLNRYIKNYKDREELSATDVFRAFNRWPTWIWANWEVVAFADWLRNFNRKKPKTKKVGFYGLDIYSLYESLEALQEYLKDKDSVTAMLVDNVVKCFETYGKEGYNYTTAGFMDYFTCENEVSHLVNQVRKRLSNYNTDHEAVFSVEQNTYVTANAERYYRTMLQGDALSWNLRDRHMFDTLERLMNFHGEKSKVIVWEHNTHIGDARATDMTAHGMYNLGELAKRQFGIEASLVGFGTFRGTVTAAKAWSAPMEQMELPPAIHGSWEEILHQTGIPVLLLITQDMEKIPQVFEPLKHRAVGVVYNSRYERLSNYVPSIIPKRYDAFIHIDETQALHPLHIIPDGKQMPETYPWGI